MTKRGFTVIELVVSIGIIMMLTILFVVNYRTTNKRTDLIMAAQNLVASFHYAQNNTLGLVKYGGIVPAGGWGIILNTASSSNNSYSMFADLNAPGTSGYLDYDPESEGDVDLGARIINLPPGIIISSLKTLEDSSVNQVNVTFLPPDPQTNIYNLDNLSTSTKLIIELKETINNSIKTIQVNFLGLAEVID